VRLFDYNFNPLAGSSDTIASAFTGNRVPRGFDGRYNKYAVTFSAQLNLDGTANADNQAFFTASCGSAADCPLAFPNCEPSLRQCKDACSSNSQCSFYIGNPTCAPSGVCDACKGFLEIVAGSGLPYCGYCDPGYFLFAGVCSLNCPAEFTSNTAARTCDSIVFIKILIF
jgi:hypothetical protein